MDPGSIVVRGARTHNLAGVSVSIPRGAMTVVSGVSGSGKSSLAFDTLFAEGRRRYLESLPSGARRALRNLPRPDVDVVEGLSPAIALSGRDPVPDPRSTLATLADFHGHLRLLFAHLGTAHCPRCGRVVKPVSPGSLAARLLREPEGTRLEILSPAFLSPSAPDGPSAARPPDRRTAAAAVAAAAKEGFVRVRIDGNMRLVEEVPEAEAAAAGRVDVVVDRIVAKDGVRTRLADSVELAMKRSGGEIRLLVTRPGASAPEVVDESDRLFCPECRLAFAKLAPSSFSFDSRAGACPRCGGLGTDGEGGAVCPDCGGARLGPAPRACRVEIGPEPHRSLPEALALPVSGLSAWARGVAEAVPPALSAALSPVFSGLVSRLGFLEKTGLGYLSCDRASDTLSGGEARRVRLASALGQDLSGALYVLDEPTAGLHPRDTAALVSLLLRLRDAGNTLVVVEHDEAVVRAADRVIDMGPGAGKLGGRVVYEGPVSGLAGCPDSPTGRFLSGAETFYVPASRPPDAARGFLKVRGARANNLHAVDARFPIGCITAVCGVSGSGKSSLVEDVLGANLSRLLARGAGRRGGAPDGGWHSCDSIGGVAAVKRVVEVGRASRAGGPRSVVATACGAMDRIRALFAATPLARSRGYGPSRFSFSAKGGRCEACKGEGETRFEMGFLPDAAAVCEECGGARYNRETLDVHWSGRSIADILACDVSAAAGIFRAVPALARLFASLEAFGLGYLSLGQRVSTLSGGEAQRLLLAAELASPACAGTLYLLDEPASGQHARDVNLLLRALESLRDAGGTVIVVEHRPQVLRAADWIVDLGPGAGAAGGEVVAEGPPAAVAATSSPTAPWLA